MDYERHAASLGRLTAGDDRGPIQADCGVGAKRGPCDLMHRRPDRWGIPTQSGSVRLRPGLLLEVPAVYVASSFYGRAVYISKLAVAPTVGHGCGAKLQRPRWPLTLSYESYARRAVSVELSAKGHGSCYRNRRSPLATGSRQQPPLASLPPN
jgi:hypothetical protein